jgi:hypothetical protein
VAKCEEGKREREEKKERVEGFESSFVEGEN